MASTTPQSDEDLQEPLDAEKGFEVIERTLDGAEDEKLDFWQIEEAYDTIIAVYPGSNRPEELNTDINPSSRVIPSREAYNTDDHDSVAELNGYIDGETLVVAFGLDAESEYGEGVPTHREMREENLSGESKWWDNPEELNADILLDRNSYYGAVDVHDRPEVFDLEYEGGLAKAYLIQN